jgi:hypothetical protein
MKKEIMECSRCDCKATHVSIREEIVSVYSIDEDLSPCDCVKQYFEDNSNSDTMEYLCDDCMKKLDEEYECQISI